MQPNVRCLLCGARMTPVDLVNACTGLTNATLGVLAACCPYCQGYFEILPRDGQLDLGYCANRSDSLFDVAQSVPFDGLAVFHQQSQSMLVLLAPDQRWEFRAEPE